jgi:hypothetical protein
MPRSRRAESRSEPVEVKIPVCPRKAIDNTQPVERQGDVEHIAAGADGELPVLNGTLAHAHLSPSGAGIAEALCTRRWRDADVNERLVQRKTVREDAKGMSQHRRARDGKRR